MREDWVGLKNLDIVCCRGSTVSGVGRGSESIFSSSAPSILGADTCRCWAVKSQRSVFSYPFVSRCYASITNIVALIALSLKRLTIYCLLIRTVIPKALSCSAVEMLLWCVFHHH